MIRGRILKMGFVFLLATLVGCSYPMSKEVRQEARPVSSPASTRVSKNNRAEGLCPPDRGGYIAGKAATG